MPYDNSYQIGSGQIRRSNSEKGAPYWGKLRITPEQLNALVAWADQNEMQQSSYGNGQEAYYELSIAAWVKEGRDGEKFHSFVVEQPYKSNRISAHEIGAGQPVNNRLAAASAADNDIPF